MRFPTEAVDFSPLSKDLTFTWTASTATETAAGYPTEGTGNIPSMTATSGSADDCDIVYTIVASYSGKTFCELSHTITLRPALEGSFTDMTPADGSQLETTTDTVVEQHHQCCLRCLPVERRQPAARDSRRRRHYGAELHLA